MLLKRIIWVTFVLIGSIAFCGQTASAQSKTPKTEFAFDLGGVTDIYPFSSASGRTHAFRCPRMTLCEAFESAAAVFVGRVIAVSEKVDPAFGAKEARFAVAEAFKGVAGDEAQAIVDLRDDTGHGPELVRGDRYLIFAVKNKNRLYAHSCSRTSPVVGAKPKIELHFLRNLSAAGAGGRIFGWVEATTTPLPGVTVVLEKDGKQQTQSRTNAEGYVEFTGLKPGRYKVRPVWPDHYTGWVDADYTGRVDADYVIEIPDQGCASFGFLARAHRKRD